MTPPTTAPAPGAARTRSHLGIRVEHHHAVDLAIAARCWEMYRDAFEPLRTRSATRHVMHEDEFMDAMGDGRLEKLVAFDREDRPVGMTLLTRDLHAIPWISPEFYAERYPEATARCAVTYVGFILVDPTVQGGLVFHQLVHRMSLPIAAESGVVAFDMCTFNSTVIRLPKAILKAIRHRNKVDERIEDVQTFYALQLSAKEA
jgi:hypothetical protein